MKRGSWKGAAIQRGFELGNLRISIVRGRWQGTAGEDIAVWIASVWRFEKCGRLAMAL
jgi:hypothetical protein